MGTGPLARRTGLVIKPVGEEVLVYDLDRHRAHSLNASAAALWRMCDGQRPAAMLAVAVREETGLAVTEATVEHGLAALHRARLLARGGPSDLRVGRRQALRGLGTMVAVPLVVSIIAPVAAQAQSCAGVGGLCAHQGTAQGNCCPGALCLNSSGTLLCQVDPSPDCTCQVT